MSESGSRQHPPACLPVVFRYTDLGAVDERYGKRAVMEHSAEMKSIHTFRWAACRFYCVWRIWLAGREKVVQVVG